MGYMAQIAKASQRFKWPSWVIYDLNFWQEAASRDSADWPMHTALPLRVWSVLLQKNVIHWLYT